MILTLEPETVELALREGILRLQIVHKDLLENAEILVYRKGKKIAAKIILNEP